MKNHYRQSNWTNDQIKFEQQIGNVQAGTTVNLPQSIRLFIYSFHNNTRLQHIPYSFLIHFFLYFAI